VGILNGILSGGGGGGAAGVTEYESYAALVAASPAPLDGETAVVTGKGLFSALGLTWLPSYIPRTSYLSAYSWRLADAAIGGSLTLGAPASKSAGVALTVAGSGAGTAAVSGTLPAEKGCVVLRGVASTVGTGAAASERGWVLLRSATNNCTYSLLLPKLSSNIAQRIDGNGNFVDRSQITTSGVIAVWWDFTSAAGGSGFWSPDDTGAPGGAGVTVLRSVLATGGTSQLRLFPSLSGTAGYTIEDWLTFSGV
jgi:hypothetical protein